MRPPVLPASTREWAEPPISMDEAAAALGVSRRTLSDTLKELPYYEARGRKKVFYPEHIAQLRREMHRCAFKSAGSTAGPMPTAPRLTVSGSGALSELRMLAAQTWRVRAGELWPTEDVLDVLGETFQRLKTTTQLWIDQVGDNQSLPAGARQELAALVDALQSDMHQSLVRMPQERATRSQIAEVEDEDEHNAP